MQNGRRFSMAIFFHLLSFKIKNVISVKEMKNMPMTGRNLFPFCKINEKNMTIHRCYKVLLINKLFFNSYFGLYIAYTTDWIIFDGRNRKNINSIR